MSDSINKMLTTRYIRVRVQIGRGFYTDEYSIVLQVPEDASDKQIKNLAVAQAQYYILGSARFELDEAITKAFNKFYERSKDINKYVKVVEVVPIHVVQG